jgi:hypothetical protein
MEHLVVLGSRLFYFGELQYIGWSVFCVNNRFHKVIFE